MGIKDRLKNEEGLTLIEVLASVAILVIILGIGMAALAQSTTLTSKIQGESQDRQDMQVGLLELTNVVQSATGIKPLKEGKGFELDGVSDKERQYFLINNQLRAGSKNGVTQIEGVESVEIVNESGVTLTINGLEKPVVLATRNLDIIKTGLTEEVDWQDRTPNVVCLKEADAKKLGIPAKDFSGYPQMELAEKNGSIQCDTGLGKITVKYQKNIQLSGGDLIVKTNEFVIAQEAHFSLSNGSIFLQGSSIDIGYLSSTKSSGSYYIAKKLITSKNKAKLESSKNIIVNGGIDFSYQAEVISTNGDIFVNGDIIDKADQGVLSSGKSITILGNLKSKYTFSVRSNDFIYIKGDLTNEKDKLEITSSKDLTVLGNVTNLFETTYDIGGSLYVGGYIDNKKDQTSLKAIGDIVVLGDVTNLYQAKMTSDKSIFIKGSLNNNKNSVTVTSKENIVVFGDVINSDKATINSGYSMFIGGHLHTARESQIFSASKLYIQNGVNVGVGAIVSANQDSFVNGVVTFPTDPYNTFNAVLRSNKTLNYTGPINGAVQDNNKRPLIQGSPIKKLPSINTYAEFPSIPLFPKEPVPPIEN